MKKETKAVRIDSELLKRIEDFLSKSGNRLKYANKKQFVDIAVLEKLEKENNIKSETSWRDKRNYLYPVKKEVPSSII